jgi:Holliday junction resolvase
MIMIWSGGLTKLFRLGNLFRLEYSPLILIHGYVTLTIAGIIQTVEVGYNMSSGYVKGTKFENEVKDILIADDWEAVRAAGSHGIVEIMAVKYGVIWFIQCRLRGNITEDERLDLIARATKHKAVPILAHKVRLSKSVSGKKRTSVVFEEIKPTKPDFHYEIVDGHWVKISNSLAATI